MINFLPPEAQTAVRREYVARTLGVWALLLAAVIAAVVVLLGPSYALLLQQLKVVLVEEIARGEDPGVQAYTTARAALEKAQVLAGQLSHTARIPLASAVLHEIEKVQVPGITVSHFAYGQADGEAARAEIRGVASTREALVAFSAALERSPMFARAEVPVSDLAEARDLPFTITIILTESGT